MFWIIAPLSLVVAYLLGSIPFAVIISRLMGLNDPRHFGSGNPGATNVLRSGNKLAAALTLLGDAAKGAVAVYLAQLIVNYYGWSTVLVGACAIAVFLGHVFPISLGFKGGKGVATAVGILLAIQPWLALACIATWLVVAVLSRYSSLAAIAAAVLAPAYYLIGAGPGTAWPMHKALAISIGVISLLLLWRHEANIRRLLLGTESRIGQKSKPQ